MFKENLNQKDSKIVFILYILLSIQNSFFDDMFSIFGMDLFSLLLSVILIIYFFLLLIKKEIKIDYFLLFFFILTIYKLLLGFIIIKNIGSILIDLRPTIYLFMTYFIFKNIKSDINMLINVIKIGGLANSIIFLYFMNNLINDYGIGARNVSINLYISLLSLSIILLFKNKKTNTIIDFFIVFINILSILLSQQRTVIIPLSIIIGIFIIKNIKISLKSLMLIIFIVIGITTIFRIMDNIGILDLVKNRFSPDLFSGENSTLTVRKITVVRALKENPWINYIFGCGFGYKYCDLEMLIPNYIIKYGVVSSIVILWNIYLGFIKYYMRYNYFQKVLLHVLLIILIGGIISGLGGVTGQMLLGFIFGILNNKKLYVKR